MKAMQARMIMLNIVILLGLVVCALVFSQKPENQAQQPPDDLVRVYTDPSVVLNIQNEPQPDQTANNAVLYKPGVLSGYWKLIPWKLEANAGDYIELYEETVIVARPGQKSEAGLVLYAKIKHADDDTIESRRLVEEAVKLGY